MIRVAIIGYGLSARVFHVSFIKTHSQLQSAPARNSRLGRTTQGLPFTLLHNNYIKYGLDPQEDAINGIRIIEMALTSSAQGRTVPI